MLQKIVEFLAPYQRLQLGLVSKAFKAECIRVLGCDPFAGYDQFAGSDWMQLGLFRKEYLEMRDSAVELAATDAYTYLRNQMNNLILENGPLNQPVVLELQQILGASERQKTDCVATLKMGTAVLWSTNFTGEKQILPIRKQIATNREKLLEGYGTQELTRTPDRFERTTQDGRKEIVPLPQRHAEMRLVTQWQLTHPEITDVELCVDKFCCIFCSSQLQALDLKNLIVTKPQTTPFGKLNWYNFSPLVVFFKETRTKLWGQAVEDKFAGFDKKAKIAFLYFLADQASPTRKEEKVRQQPDSGHYHGALAVKKPKTEQPKCPKCNAVMTWRDTSRPFWGCSKYASTKCTGKRDSSGNVM